MKSELPADRPPYIAESVWDRIKTTPRGLGSQILHQMEEDIAYMRAANTRRYIEAEIEDGGDPLDILESYGGPEELERVVGSNWRKSLTPKPDYDIQSGKDFFDNT